MELLITWLGAAGIWMKIGTTEVVFDPYFHRLHSSDSITTKIELLANANAVFITHGHFDHIGSVGWFLYKGIPVYSSQSSFKGIERWSNIENLNANFRPYHFINPTPTPFTPKSRSRLHAIKAKDKIHLNSSVYIEALPSEHIRFDFETFYSRLKKLSNLRYLSASAKLGRWFPKADVLGYCVHYKGKRIVIYGSLSSKHAEYFRDTYKDCDLLLIPLAGNSADNMAKKGLELTKKLSPKMVIPIHQDNFFPPISRKENIHPYKEELEKHYPKTPFQELKLGKTTTIFLE